MYVYLYTYWAIHLDRKSDVSYAIDEVVLMQLVYYTEVGPGISHLYLKYPASKLCQLSYTLYSEWISSPIWLW